MNFTETLKSARLNVMVERGYKYSPMGKIGNFQCAQGSPPARRAGFFMRGVCTLIAFKRTVLSPRNRREEIKRSAEKNKVRIYVGNICGLASKNQIGCENLSDLKRVLDRLVAIRSGGYVEPSEFREELNSSIRGMIEVDRRIVLRILTGILTENDPDGSVGSDQRDILQMIFNSALVGGQTPVGPAGNSIGNNARQQIKPVPARVPAPVPVSAFVPTPTLSNGLHAEPSRSTLSNDDDSLSKTSSSMKSDPGKTDAATSDSLAPNPSGTVLTGELPAQPSHEHSIAVGAKSKQNMQKTTGKLPGIFGDDKPGIFSDDKLGIFSDAKINALPSLEDLTSKFLPNASKQSFHKESGNAKLDGVNDR